jgi:hypothetical protein
VGSNPVRIAPLLSPSNETLQQGCAAVGPLRAPNDTLSALEALANKEARYTLLLAV